MFSLLKKIRTLSLPSDLKIELFDKMIKPILLYGAEIYGFGNCDVIERVNLKFIKCILKLKKSTPSHMIHGELGIFPITLEIRHRALTYWCKLITDCTNETLGTQKLSTRLFSILGFCYATKKKIYICINKFTMVKRVLSNHFVHWGSLAFGKVKLLIILSG